MLLKFWHCIYESKNFGIIFVVFFTEKFALLTETAHSHQSVLNHLFYHAIHWSGVSDHKVRNFLGTHLEIRIIPKKLSIIFVLYIGKNLREEFCF